MAVQKIEVLLTVLSVILSSSQGGEWGDSFLVLSDIGLQQRLVVVRETVRQEFRSLFLSSPGLVTM